MPSRPAASGQGWWRPSEGLQQIGRCSAGSRRRRRGCPGAAPGLVLRRGDRGRAPRPRPAARPGGPGCRRRRGSRSRSGRDARARHPPALRRCGSRWPVRGLAGGCRRQPRRRWLDSASAEESARGRAGLRDARGGGRRACWSNRAGIDSPPTRRRHDPVHRPSDSSPDEEWIAPGCRYSPHPEDTRAQGRPGRGRASSAPRPSAGLADLEVGVIEWRQLAERLGNASLRPDLVIVARVNMALAAMPILRAHVPGVPVIFDTVDLHYGASARSRVRARPRRLPAGARRQGPGAPHRARERSRVGRQRGGATGIAGGDPQLSITVLSMIHEIPARGPGYEARQGLGFVGGFQHAPNVDAVRFLVQDVAPRLRAARPDAWLSIRRGPTCPARSAPWSAPGVRMVGTSATSRRCWRGGGCSWLPPVRGRREGKDHPGPEPRAARRHHLLGAEGTGFRHGKEVMIADTPGAFAASALALYESREQWERLSRAGQAAIEARFSSPPPPPGSATISRESPPPGGGTGRRAEGGAVLTFEELMAQPPLIHNDRTITWGIRPALAEFLDARIGPGAVTLETGAGLSTLVILRKRPRQHTAIQPVADEFAAILESPSSTRSTPARSCRWWRPPSTGCPGRSCRISTWSWWTVPRVSHSVHRLVLRRRAAPSRWTDDRR